MEIKTNFSIKDIKIAFLTLGCKVNSYETEAMQALLAAAGATLVGFDEVKSFESSRQVRIQN